VTLLQLLALAAGVPASGIVRLIEQAKYLNPDLAPLADEWLGKLNAAVDQSNLVDVASKLPAEIANIAGGRLSPRDSPSGAI